MTKSEEVGARKVQTPSTFMEPRVSALEVHAAALAERAARLLWDPATQPNKYKATDDSEVLGGGADAGTPPALLALRAEHVRLRTELVTAAYTLTKLTTARRKGSTPVNPAKAFLRAATDGQLELITELLATGAVHVDQVGSGQSKLPLSRSAFRCALLEGCRTLVQMHCPAADANTTPLTNSCPCTHAHTHTQAEALRCTWRCNRTG
jgi:hypothetical protein